MKRYPAKVISSGITIGTIRVMQKKKIQIEKRHVKDVEAEILRYKDATREAIEQLQELSAKALLEMGKEGANIFGGHTVLLCDEEYQGLICELLHEEQVNAEYAVSQAAGQIAERFEALDDDYIKERANDIKDVSKRLISILSNEQYSLVDDNTQECTEPTVLMAEELLPADVLELKNDNLCGIVTQKGNSHSHAAILAKTLGIPAITQVDFSKEFQGKTCIVDGINGILIIEPDEKEMASYKEMQKKLSEKQLSLQELKGKKTKNKSGKMLKLYANVGNIADVELAIQNDAEGIGLFRSEFLFIGKNQPPTEEEQLYIYKHVTQMMEGKPVVIRTLDLGDDKQVSYFNTSENNLRGIQFCLKHEDVFKTQLKAIFRAAAFGDVSVLYPMVNTLDEIQEINRIVRETVEELKGEGIDYVKPKQGIMIETPQAARISDVLMQNVDFASIGTNDLTCYTLSIDRQEEFLFGTESKEYKKVWELIKLCVENAHKVGIPVGICGEMGAEMVWAKRFWELSVDLISMVPKRILPTRSLFAELEDTLSL